MQWLIQQFGSKKLLAAVAAILAILAVPILNSKLGLNLTEDQVTKVILSVLSPALLYVLAQWHIDVSTKGATTTAAVVAQRLAQAAAAALPAQTLVAKIAKALEDALSQSDDSTVANAGSAALVNAALPPPPTPPAAQS
jgi:heterodisulfide reductase subunit A-like polyferredoxin